MQRVNPLNVAKLKSTAIPQQNPHMTRVDYQLKDLPCVDFSLGYVHTVLSDADSASQAAYNPHPIHLDFKVKDGPLNS